MKFSSKAQQFSVHIIFGVIVFHLGQIQMHKQQSQKLLALNTNTR